MNRNAHQVDTSIIPFIYRCTKMIRHTEQRSLFYKSTLGVRALRSIAMSPIAHPSARRGTPRRRLLPIRRRNARVVATRPRTRTARWSWCVSRGGNVHVSPASGRRMLLLDGEGGVISPGASMSAESVVGLVCIERFSFRLDLSLSRFHLSQKGLRSEKRK